MSKFVEGVEFIVHECGECGVSFAMSANFQRRRLVDSKTWYCVNGHPRHFTGQTEEQKLRDEVERQKQIAEAAQSRAAEALTQRDQVARAHKKMRARVMNGVCPCCNRTFQNLMQHMKTEHPEFNTPKTVAAIRQAFGMTQRDVANEAGVNTMHVSLYEREKPLAAYAKCAIDAWVGRYQATESAG